MNKRFYKREMFKSGMGLVYPRLPVVYSLLIGLLGVAVLVQLVEYQTASFDLWALLAFAVVAMLVSYFRLPMGQDGAELNLEGAVLLGAMLTGGPIVGGWAAFIAGLATGLAPYLAQRHARKAWIEHVASAACHGGRNVMAIGGAWTVLTGLGGSLHPATVQARTVLALVLMCLVYVLLRLILYVPVVLLAGRTDERAWARTWNPTQILLELAPLPAALLIAPVWAAWTWARLLTLAIMLVGVGALVRHMRMENHQLQDRVQELLFAQRVHKEIQHAAGDLDALSRLTQAWCAEIVSCQCEMGIFDAAQDHAGVYVRLEDGRCLPPMHIPITTMWQWAASLAAPHLVDTPESFAELPFNLPPFESGLPVSSALFIPLHRQPAAAPGCELPLLEPAGALILLSAQPHALGPAQTGHLNTVAQALSAKLPDILAFQSRACEPELLSGLQRRLISPCLPPCVGWEVALACQTDSPDGGVWYSWLDLPAQAVGIALGQMQGQGAATMLAAAAAQALFQSLPPQIDVTPAQIVRNLNVCLSAAGNPPLSLLYAVLDQDGVLTCAGMGATAVWWWQHGQRHVQTVRASNAPGSERQSRTDDQTGLAPASGDVVILSVPNLLHGCGENQNRPAWQQWSLAVEQWADAPIQDMADGLLSALIDMAQADAADGSGRAVLLVLRRQEEG